MPNQRFLVVCELMDHHPATQRGHLDRALIVSTARQILQQEGLQSLTLRRLGEALHVDATAMYRHIANKSALLTAVFEELFKELEPPDPAEPWRTNLTNLMHAWWRIYRDNREIAANLTKSPFAGGGRTMIRDWIKTELTRAGISRDLREQYIDVICAHVMGYGLLCATQEITHEQQEKTFTVSVNLLLASL